MAHVLTTACPECGKAVHVKDVPLKGMEKSVGAIAKTRVVIFDSGKVLVKCRECGEIVKLPYRVTEGNDL